MLLIQHQGLRLSILTNVSCELSLKSFSPKKKILQVILTLFNPIYFLYINAIYQSDYICGFSGASWWSRYYSRRAESWGKLLISLLNEIPCVGATKVK